jgi:hypothetical protein
MILLVIASSGSLKYFRIREPPVILCLGKKIGVKELLDSATLKTSKSFQFA